jgi:hypothetical protein
MLSNKLTSASYALLSESGALSRSAFPSRAGKSERGPVHTTIVQRFAEVALGARRRVKKQIPISLIA